MSSAENWHSHTVVSGRPKPLVRDQHTEEHPDVVSLSESALSKLPRSFKGEVQNLLGSDEHLQRFGRRLAMHVLEARRLGLAPPTGAAPPQRSSGPPQTSAAKSKDMKDKPKLMFAGGRTQTRKTHLIAAAAAMARAMKVPTVVVTSSCLNRDNLTKKIQQVSNCPHP